MASNLRRTDELQRLKVRELVLQQAGSGAVAATSLLTVDGTGQVVAGATGTIGDLVATNSVSTADVIASDSITATNSVTTANVVATNSVSTKDVTASNSVAANTIYTNNICPYPAGSTGECNITGRFTVNNNISVNRAESTLIQMMQTDTGGTGAAGMYIVGEDSNGFGGTPNDRNQFCLYSYPKPARAPIRKVESTPLMAGITGPVGLTGQFGDKYFYGNTQVGGYLAARTGMFGGPVGIGVGSAVHALDVNGNVYIQGSTTASNVFAKPGRYTIRIPKNVTTATVTLVGAGGGGASGGYGGYIQGTFDASLYVGRTLTIQVGDIGTPTKPNTLTPIPDTPSQASFVSFLDNVPTPLIIAMAGAGGCQGDGTIQGGHGGGGVNNFISITGGGSVGIGTNGDSSVTAKGGQCGRMDGGGDGGAGISSNGKGRPSPETYVDVSGGVAIGSSAGGNGYTSGGAGGFAAPNSRGGGGGGSSFISSGFTLLQSYRGDDATNYNANVPSVYGRSGIGGYVSISYSNQPSLYTSGDIVSGGGLCITAPTVPTGSTAAGNPGQIAWGKDALNNYYIYVCLEKNKWGRAALDTTGW